MQVSDPFFIAFAFVFASSRLKLLSDLLIIGKSARAWLNEHRIYLIKTVTCYACGSLDCMMNKLGLRQANFLPTNKAGDIDKNKYYEMGKFDFRTSYMFLIPLGTLVILNLTCFVGGVARVIVTRNWDAMLAQMLFSFYVLIMSFPVIEGMVFRKDDGRVSLLSTLMSTVVSLVFLSLGYFLLLH
uniref:Cellulose synthase (UDP-forming) n=1 Tax=Opuntia streptacantha TaxID=393608 RepID=A0A7C9CJA1_OPUST